MSLLKLRERGLMVLLFFVFLSCDKLRPPSGNGVDIPVKIRAVSIAGGAKNKIVRAGGEKRITGQPIIRDLGGRMVAEITVDTVESAPITFLPKENCTLTITPKEVSLSKKFAGSNIYWDGSKLTFADHGRGIGSDTAKYQGVFFKWGSLIGVSPAQTGGSNDFSSGTAADQTTGTPIYMKDPDGNWVKTNVAYATSQNWFSGSGWGAIPSGSTAEPHGPSAYTLLTLHSDFAGYRGDICNYIKPNYRMPTMTELGGLGDPTSGATSSTTSDDPTGKYVFNSNNFCTFTISGAAYTLPASGCRSSSSGTLDSVGDFGYYWSGSAADSGNAYELNFDSGNAYADDDTLRNFGQPVRCVLQE